MDPHAATEGSADRWRRYLELEGQRVAIIDANGGPADAADRYDQIRAEQAQLRARMTAPELRLLQEWL